MTDFLNKTWTIDADERLDEEMLDECCSSSMHVQQQQHQQTFLVDSQNEPDDDKNTTRTIMDTTKETGHKHNNNSYVKCMFDIENLFNKLSSLSEDNFLLHEDLSGIWTENSEPICTEIPLSNTVYRAAKQSSAKKSNEFEQLEVENIKFKAHVTQVSSNNHINNQTVNIDDEDNNNSQMPEINNKNLNVTVNINEAKPIISSSSNVNLNVTIDINEAVEVEVEEDATNAAPLVNEKLNITIDKNKTQEIIQPSTVLNNNFAPIPNSFDMFADDLNKQSGLNSPTSSSSASSSTSSLTSNKMYYNNKSNRGSLPVTSKLANYKTSIKILTSSIDKDLNKIAAKEEPTKSPLASQLKPKQGRISTYGHPQPQTTQARSSMPSIPTGLPKQTQISSNQVLRNATNNSNNNKNPNTLNTNVKNNGTVIRKKSMLAKKSIGSPSTPSTNINNQTIDIGDENKIKSNDIFTDIEVTNLIQPVLNFGFAPIPNSFDMFANDLNNQTILNSPPSSTSSSTSSLASNKMHHNSNRGVLPVHSKLVNYKNSVKILTSSIDKDLNKISSTPTPNPVNMAKQEQIKPKTAATTSASTVTAAHAPRSMIPSLKTSSGIPVPAKSLIPMFKPTTGILRNSTNNIAVKK